MSTKRYNALNGIKIDLSKSGICSYCGRRFTDNLCTHATAEQVKFTQELDKQADYEQGLVEQKKICNRTIAILAPAFDKLGEALETAYSIPEEMFPFIFRTASDSTRMSEEDGCGNDPDLVTELRNQGW